MNVITGETGAGKSLLVDALAFVLGGAADRGMMRRGADSMSVEAVFAAGRATHTREALVELGVGVDDEDGVAVLFREVHLEGRTVSRLNGRAVPVSTLRAVGGALVDIHGQGSHLSLLEPRFQMRVLDDFGGLGERRDSCRACAVAETRRVQGELDESQRQRHGRRSSGATCWHSRWTRSRPPLRWTARRRRCSASGTCWSTRRACGTPALPRTRR